MADIIYTLEGSPYFNLTNKCPCKCAFCIRDKKDVVGEAKKLWHDTEPTFEEVKAVIDSFDFSPYNTAVFCGYGEPSNNLDVLLKTAAYMKEVHPEIKLRLNTNGLCDLINGRETAKDICRNIDAISISLNDSTSEKYDKITRNIYPGKAFGAMLKFTADCLKYCNNVTMTVVDVIPPESIEEARKVCESIGANFRVRSFSKGR